MNPVAATLAALALTFALDAQTAPPSAAPPWRARPVIVVDPRAFLATPTPRPKPHATRAPKHRTPNGPRPEIFGRYDTAPVPSPSPKTRDKNA